MPFLGCPIGDLTALLREDLPVVGRQFAAQFAIALARLLAYLLIVMVCGALGIKGAAHILALLVAE